MVKGGYIQMFGENMHFHHFHFALQLSPLPSFRFHLPALFPSLSDTHEYDSSCFCFFFLFGKQLHEFTFLKIQKYITSVVQWKHLHISVSVTFIVTLLYFTGGTRIETQNSSKQCQTKRSLLRNHACILNRRTQVIIVLFFFPPYHRLNSFSVWFGSGPWLCILYRVTRGAA